MSLIFPIKKFLKSIPKIEAHIHTDYSDGNNSVSQVVEKSVNMGLVHIAFTEHTEEHLHKNDPDWFFRYFDEIDRIKVKWKNRIRISAGIEAPVVDFCGNLDLSSDILDRAEFVLGTVHRYPDIKKNQQVSELDPQLINKLEYKALMGLAENSSIDAIAHIGGTCGKYGKKLSWKQISDIIKKAKKNLIGIEINSKYHHSLQEFIDICMEEECLVTMGSDCHSLESIGTCRKAVKRLLFNKSEFNKYKEDE